MTARSPLTPPPDRRRLAALAVVAALALLLGACSGDDASTSASNEGREGTSTTATTAADAPTTEAPSTTEAPAVEVSAPGSFAVGTTTDTVVDDSRVTAASNGQPELPERTLPTLVFYPAEGAFAAESDTPDAPALPGPWPLVVFSHGLGAEGPSYTETLRVFASAGYVVVAPTYPLANVNSPGGPSAADIPAQAVDVGVLIDWALEQAEADDGPLAGTIDPDRIGLGGHSLGAFTSLGAGYNPCCRDDRVQAVAEWAGGYAPLGSGDEEPVTDGPPLLIVHGDADGTVDYGNVTAVREAVDAPTAVVTLVGGAHIPPFLLGLSGDAASTVVTTTTLAFFDQHLKDDAAGPDRIQAAVDEAGPDVATLELDES